jgi:hypothetical protein
VITALTVAGLLAVGFSDRYVPAVADWYTDMVIRFVPEAESNFLPVDDGERAFLACARSVVKRMDSESSIATFASSGGASTVATGEDRYEVRSFVDEASEDGVVRRKAFTCTVRFDARGWIVEAVTVDAGTAEQVAEAAGVGLPARPVRLR